MPEAEDGRFRISIAACYGYLGDLYREQGKLDEAVQYYEKAVQTGNDKVKANGLGQFYSGLGQVRMLQGRYEEGEKYLQEAIGCLERHGYYWGREKAEACLAQLLLKTGRKKEAKKYFAESRKISRKIKNPPCSGRIPEVPATIRAACRGAVFPGVVPKTRPDGRTSSAGPVNRPAALSRGRTPSPPR